jgi:hypothetical protein
MTKEHDGYTHVIRNSTAVIKGILKPYHDRKVLDDQHYVLILLQLRELEKTCVGEDLPEKL